MLLRLEMALSCIGAIDVVIFKLMGCFVYLDGAEDVLI